MTVDRIQEFNLPRIRQDFVVNRALTATGNTVIIRGGQHPKIRLIGGRIQTIVHVTTAPVINIQDMSANNILTATASTTVGASVDFTFSTNTGRDLTVLNENQDLVLNVGTAGGAASAYVIVIEATIENSIVPGN